MATSLEIQEMVRVLRRCPILLSVIEDWLGSEDPYNSDLEGIAEELCEALAP